MNIFAFILGGVILIHVASASHCQDTKSQKQDDTLATPNTSINSYGKDAELNKKEYEDAVKAMSTLYGIKSLKSGGPIKGFELRLWSVPGTEYPSCLILRKSEGRWSGRLLSSDMAKAVNGMKSIKVKEGLVPRSGWDFVENLFESMGVKPPLPFSFDANNPPPIPDEGEVFLEVRQDDAYDLVVYRAFTREPDGKALLGLCIKLQKDFDLTIPCFQYK